MRPFIYFFSLFGLMASLKAQNIAISFTVDMNQMQLVTDPNNTVGIRGGTPPLSWEQSIQLKDEDHDGIFEGTIIFEDSSIAKEISYKFVMDLAENTKDPIVWELNRYGQFGNRTLIVEKGPQYAPPAKWDQFDYRQKWKASEMHSVWTLNKHLKLAAFIDISPEQIGKLWGQEELENWDYVVDAESMFQGLEYDLAAFPMLALEMIRLEPDFVQYRMNRPLKAFLPKNLPEGMINPDDLLLCYDAMYSYIAQQKGLRYEVKMSDEDRLVTIKAQ